MRRGRPPHPDILTPREWEVLALLREGLTNEQIASRLGISLAGARYHVSEILSKLAVSTRQEAAAWQPEVAAPRRVWSLGFAGALVQKLPMGLVGKGLAVAVVGASVAGVLFVALGVTVMSRRDTNEASLLSIAHGVELGRLAYVQDGDVWVMSLPDGDPVRITTNGEASRLQWSASGEWLSVGDEIVSADGTRRRYAPSCAGWSPFADEIICTVVRDDGFNTLRIEDPHGAVLQEIEVGARLAAARSDLQLHGVGCTWSPDGARFACVAAFADPEAEPQASGPTGRYSGLWIVGRDGGQPRELLFSDVDSMEGGDIDIASWSEDGETILFDLNPFRSNSIPNDGVVLHAVSVSTGEIRDLPVGLLTRHDLHDWDAFTERLLITEGLGRETWTEKRVAFLDLTTNSLVYLTEPTEAAFSPDLSPDGSTIAYVSGPDLGHVGGGDPAREGAAQRRIWLMDTNGANKRRLTDDPAYRDEHPRWSSDGRHILFARIDAEDEASLWLVPASGGQPEKIVTFSRRQAASGLPLWFGYYGYIAWDSYYTWWQPR